MFKKERYSDGRRYRERQGLFLDARRGAGEERNNDKLLKYRGPLIKIDLMIQLI